jgi:hypothetical protein
MFHKAGLKSLMNKLTGESRVLMRADFNVPIVDGKITDITRVKSKMIDYHRHHSNNPGHPLKEAKVLGHPLAFGPPRWET